MTETKSITEMTEELSREEFGTVPPMIAEMNKLSPAVALNYVTGIRNLKSSALRAVEQHAVQLKVSLLNRCASCVKGHSYLLKQAGMSPENVNAIQHGLPIEDERINGLLAATEILFQAGKTGFENGLFYEDLSATGVTPKEATELIGFIALKTISNYFNNYMTYAKQASPLRA